MASLVLVTREGRLFLKIGGVIFAILMVLFLFIKGGSLIRDTFFPKPPPPPAQAFGKLPKISFKQQNTKVIQYTIDTLDGSLPQLPKRVNIYKLKSNSPSLLALEEAKNTLDSANFVENQVKLSDTLYRWTQAKTGVVIEYDIVNKNFLITSNYLVNPNLTSTGPLPSEDNIKSDTKGFLNKLSANTENLDFEKTKVEFLQEQNGQLIAAQNLGLARFARVTFYQNAIDDIETVYGNPEGSLLSFIISYPALRFQVLEGIFYNHEADLEQVSDYPLKSATQAFEDLKNGNALFMNPENLTNINLTNVDLKYYLGKENQGYLLPLIVFTGVNFKAYVEALPESSINADFQPEMQN